MLRIVRIVLAALCFAAICLLFVDVSGLFAPSLAFMAKAQLVPAVTVTDKVACTACAKICPPRVINLVGPDDAPKKPVVDAERCTGCGACEYVCPARPFAAIHVEGVAEQRRI